jgi:hypothetical protein
MPRTRCTLIACILMAALPALAADKPASSSAPPVVRVPDPATASRPTAAKPVAPRAPGASAITAGTPLECVAWVKSVKTPLGGGGLFRTYSVTNSLGGRLPLPAGRRIRWSGSALFDDGEFVLEAVLLPGQSVEVGHKTGDFSHLAKGVAPTCEAALMP